MLREPRGYQTCDEHHHHQAISRFRFNDILNTGVNSIFPKFFFLFSTKKQRAFKAHHAFFLLFYSCTCSLANKRSLGETPELVSPTAIPPSRFCCSGMVCESCGRCPALLPSQGLKACCASKREHSVQCCTTLCCRKTSSTRAGAPLKASVPANFSFIIQSRNIVRAQGHFSAFVRLTNQPDACLSNKSWCSGGT